MHGLGNDFVVLDGRCDPIAMNSRLAAAIADRQRGVGCDQLILLEPSTTADLRMTIYNADGGTAGACGNAARCVIALTRAASIETDGGHLSGSADGAAVNVTLGEPRFAWADVPLAYAMDTTCLPLSWDDLVSPFAVNVGNPHVVFFVGEIDEEALRAMGPIIENDPAFPQRVNVNVASLANEDGSIRLRTWERGAGLTLACGTGACATAVAAIVTKRATSPVTVHMTGGSLVIEWAPGNTIRMRGAATHVFSGEIDLASFGG